MNQSDYKQEFLSFKAKHPVHFIQTEFGPSSYISCGNGTETILLLHGLAGDAESVYRFILAFKKDFKIISPTIPELKESTVEQTLEFITAILVKEQLKPSIVIGGSFGGIIAQAYWYANIHTVTKVVLFDTSAPDKALGIKGRNAIKLVQFIPWFIFKPLFKLKLRKLFKTKAVTNESLKELLSFSKDNYSQRIDRISKGLLLSHSKIVFDFMVNATVPGLSEWNGQLLVILSDDDPANKGADVLFKKTYPQAEIVSFSGAGHIGAVVYFDKYISEMRKIVSL